MDFQRAWKYEGGFLITSPKQLSEKASKAEKMEPLINSFQSSKAPSNNQQRHLPAAVNCLMGAGNNINCQIKSCWRSTCWKSFMVCVLHNLECLWYDRTQLLWIFKFYSVTVSFSCPVLYFLVSASGSVKGFITYTQLGVFRWGQLRTWWKTGLHGKLNVFAVPFGESWNWGRVKAKDCLRLWDSSTRHPSSCVL